jgi:hypothetical protein
MPIVLQASLFEGEFVPYCTICQQWATYPMDREQAKSWALGHKCDEAED